MIYGFLITLFVFVCFLLMLLILIQKGKGSMGLGGMGGGTQMLFGGSGGQELFQKTTWFLGAIFLGGSLILALMKTAQRSTAYQVDPIAQEISQENTRRNHFPALPSKKTKQPTQRSTENS